MLYPGQDASYSVSPWSRLCCETVCVFQVAVSVVEVEEAIALNVVNLDIGLLNALEDPQDNVMRLHMYQ